ncbi:MAG TPA: arabinofuranosidase catalytic domain-containing protein [Acidobacteriaceae bacterium]|jgi:hypothetical protein
MKTRVQIATMLTLALTVVSASWMLAQKNPARASTAPSRPQGPCDIYAAAGDPCVAAHSTTRALFASYNGPLYQVLRQSDGKTMDIGVVQPTATPVADPGGYANAAAQDAFCSNTYCWISKVYDQSPKHNDLTQAPRGGFSGPAMGGFNNLPMADMAPVTIMGHKVYGVFIVPGMGIRNDDPKGTAVDDQAEGQYWVINGRHFNSGCCFDYGNAETDSRDDDNGTMETTYYGDSTGWYHGKPVGPWVMTDQENNLVGCVNPDGSKLCATLPNITWRFVTGVAKGEAHHWTSMGADAQQGELAVMFDGPRIDATYDPMRKQGAILLGNGGDNSNSSQGTFYEGAMTAAGTFPTNATDQLVQANVVSARYATLPVSIAPAAATATPPGIQTFSPGASQDTTVTFTNTTASPVAGVKLGLSLPNQQWTAFITGSKETSKTFAGPVAPGASVSATFHVTAGPARFNGDLAGNASWTDQANGAKESGRIVEKVRSVDAVKINEFRITSGPSQNTTNSFIELYNAGASGVDLSGWTLTEHPMQRAIFSAIEVPAGTKLAPHGFYLLGLANSGLAAAARAGDSTLYVRNTSGMSAGDTLTVGTGAKEEKHKIANVGTAAGNGTTLWQPLPDGPVISIPVGSTNVPVTSTYGLTVGEKIALGYGATYPAVASGREHYEVVTVTAVGKPGTQAYLEADAPAGSTNLKVSSVNNISVGDKIRLDIDSQGHGIETVTVTHVGTRASRTNLVGNAAAGATTVRVRNANGFAIGDKITIGTPATKETVTVTAVTASDRGNAGLEFTPALTRAHIGNETVVSPGTGIDVAAPLKFQHASNMPFSNRGTGVTFTPATAFVHASNEPVVALGTGITLDGPLASAHAIDSVVRDAVVTTAGYQGTPAPNQWFGGPDLAANNTNFDGTTISLQAGSMVLRDAHGLVVDSLNYGLVVDPWAAEGYQETSGPTEHGCRVNAPNLGRGFGPPNNRPDVANTSAGRFPDGVDTGSNCTDFVTESATGLSTAAPTGSTNIKVGNASGFDAGQTITIDSGANLETAVITEVGTGGATTASSAVSAGATVIPVTNIFGFENGQKIVIGEGANMEAATVEIANRRGSSITLTAPTTHEHAAGSSVAGTGLTLASALTHPHASGVQVVGSPSTPGAPNRYRKKQP